MREVLIRYLLGELSPEEHDEVHARLQSSPELRQELARLRECFAAHQDDDELTGEGPPSGLASRQLEAGKGTKRPGPRSRVLVHYSGWTTDGEMFDSSVAKNQQATFPVARVIAGFSEGIQLMVVGEKRRLWIPEALAYRGQPGAPAGMLVFDVELIRID